MIAGVILLLVVVVLWFCTSKPKSLREEERELREYFRRKDAAEKRGEIFPPHDGPRRPGGRMW